MSKIQGIAPVMQAGRLVAFSLMFVLINGPLAAQPPDPPPGFHGMLVLGTRGEIYLLHLAMRNVPQHMFQLVVRIELEGSSRTRIGDRDFLGEAADLATVSPDQVYFLDRNHPGNDVAVYTFQPAESFVLTEIPDGRRLTFRGDIVRGHFERDPNAPAILRDVIVSVRDIVFFQDLRALDSNAPHPLAEGKRELLLFGANEEYFLTHRITLHGDVGQPDNNAFHQVFPLTADTSAGLRFEPSSRAVAVEIEGSETALLPTEGGLFPAQLRGLVDDVALPLTLELGPEHYFEELMKAGAISTD